MASVLILAVCFGGLGLIVWWRVLQCRTLGVPYMDGVRVWCLIICGLIGAGWAALASHAVAFH
jgi:hypothetical protein